MFYIAAVIMLAIWLLLFFLLPEVEPEYTGTYGALMKSLVSLVREEPALRVAAIRGALCFACFSAFWDWGYPVFSWFAQRGIRVLRLEPWDFLTLRFEPPRALH